MRVRRALAIGWLVATGCGGDGGCRFENTSLVVLHAIPPTVEDEGCVFDPNSQIIVYRGRLDVAWGTGYLLGVVLSNNLVATTQEGSNTGVEDGDLQLSSPVDVTLHVPRDVADRMGPGPDGQPLPLSFEVPIATSTLRPETEYGMGLVAVPREYAMAFAAAIDPGEEVDITIEVVFHATRTSNTRGNLGVIDSPPFEFPITLVNGGLVAACRCDELGRCEPGTEQPALLCGYAQDVTVTPMCLEAESSGESTDAPAEASGSSGV
jgi:hypothetical protein